jgi:hypothetical protein
MRAQQEALKGCFDDLLEARVVGVCCALHVVRFEGPAGGVHAGMRQNQNQTLWSLCVSRRVAAQPEHPAERV